MEGVEVKVGLVVMVGLGQGLGQKLPWHQWGRKAAVRYHTGSCCAPFASSPSLPKLHPSCSSPSSSPCHCQCHNQPPRRRGRAGFHKQGCPRHHQRKAGKHSYPPQWPLRQAAWRQLLSKRSHPLMAHRCGL